MAAYDDGPVVICAPVNTVRVPHPTSVQTVCSDCGYAVWVSQAMKTNVLDADPTAKARCMTCARKRAIRGEYDGVEFELPGWQRAELAAIGVDLDALSARATRWLTEG